MIAPIRLNDAHATARLCRRLGCAVLGISLLSGCALPARSPALASAAGFEEPTTGSLIAGAGDSERVGSNGDPSFYQPQHGYGAAGTGLNAGGR